MPLLRPALRLPPSAPLSRRKWSPNKTRRASFEFADMSAWFKLVDTSTFTSYHHPIDVHATSHQHILHSWQAKPGQTIHIFIFRAFGFMLLTLEFLRLQRRTYVFFLSENPFCVYPAIISVHETASKPCNVSNNSLVLCILPHFYQGRQGFDSCVSELEHNLFGNSSQPIVILQKP